MVKKNIAQSAIAKISKILDKYPEILFAYIFGSYAKGNVGPMSDIDLGIFFDPRISQTEQEQAEERLELAILQTLGLAGDDKIHITVLNDVGHRSPLLDQEIVYKGKLLNVKDDGMRAHYEASAIHRWLDFKPHQEKFNQATFKNLAKPVKAFKIYA